MGAIKKETNITRHILLYSIRAILIILSGALFEIGTSYIVERMDLSNSVADEVLSKIITLILFIIFIFCGQCLIARKVRPIKHLDNDLGPISTGIAVLFGSFADNLLGSFFFANSIVTALVLIFSGALCVIINTAIVDKGYERIGLDKYIWDVSDENAPEEKDSGDKYIEYAKRDIYKTMVLSAIMPIIVSVICVIVLLLIFLGGNK